MGTLEVDLGDHIARLPSKKKLSVGVKPHTKQKQEASIDLLASPVTASRINETSGPM